MAGVAGRKPLVLCRLGIAEHELGEACLITPCGVVGATYLMRADAAFVSGYRACRSTGLEISKLP